MTGGRLSSEGKEESIYTLDSLTVSTRRPPRAVVDPLTESLGLKHTSSLVTEKDIQRQNAKHAAEALKYLPGAWSEKRGRKVKQFVSFRGQKYPYPDYAVDGIWQREFLELPYFFPASDIKSIQVIRSSGALINGVSGLTGIINIIPRDYDSLGISVETEYGSFNSLRSSAVHGNTLKGLSYAVGLGGHSTEGPEGRHAEENLLDLYGRVKWSPSDRLTLQSNGFFLRGLRQFARAQPPASKPFQNLIEQYDPFQALILNLKGFYQFSDRVSSSLQLYWTQRDHDFVSETMGHVTTRELDWEWGAHFINAISFTENNVFRVGGLYNNWVAPDGKRFYAGKRSDVVTLSAVAADEQTFGPLTLDGGVRWVQRYLDEYGAFGINGSNKGPLRAADIVRDKWEMPAFNANAGAVYRFPRVLSLAGNWAAGVVQPREGTLTVEQKKPENEIQHKVDAGPRLQSSNLGVLTLSGFYTFRNDAISLTNDTLRTSDGLLMALYENRDRRTAGLEVEARSIELLGIAQFLFNAAVMRHWAEDSGEMKPDDEKPEMILSGGTYITWKGVDANLLIKYVSEYRSKRFAADYHNLGDYTTIDGSLGYTLNSKRRHDLRIYCSLKNIWDEPFSTVVGYPDFGRKMALGVQYTL